MPIDMKFLVKRLKPENTVLLFGAGSSVPSGAPSGQGLSDLLAEGLGFPNLKGFALTDAAGIISKKIDRSLLIRHLQKIVLPLKPTRGLINLPILDWKEIYTTNYDTLIEQVYTKANKPFSVISTNYDLNGDSISNGVPIYKLHGTIDRDVSLGDGTSRIIITHSDYDQTSKFRQSLYDRFRDQLNRSDLIIIGSSLADPDLREVIDRAITLKSEGASGAIYLLVYNSDPDRAALYEDRGLQVCFGGIDTFFDHVLSEASEHGPVVFTAGDIFDESPLLRTSCVDVSHALASGTQNANRLFHGQPANYGDIARGLTFTRDLTARICNQFNEGKEPFALVLGVAGVGKTSLCRQVLSALSYEKVLCWEHDDDRPLDAKLWLQTARKLSAEKKWAVLFVDNCHEHLRQVNFLAEALGNEKLVSLKLLLTSNPAAWNPRVKSPLLYAKLITYPLRRLSEAEIENVLNLVDGNVLIRQLVEPRFLGFQRAERRSRLFDRCGSDTFVCMKNIFAFDAIDDIILNEYATLEDQYREIYRFIAALEASGVRIHRQFVIRVLGIKATAIASILDHLTDTVSESSINEKEGIYSWSGRHLVISEILAGHEFRDQDELFNLFCNVADNINPTYPIELRSVRELCGRNLGILRLHNVSKQNVVLRKLISSAPGEKVPRHRLITNLIGQKDFAQAESEIRIYEKEFSADPVVTRFRILTVYRRAEHNTTMLPEHRANLGRDAAQMTENALAKFSNDKNLHDLHLQIGRFVFNVSGKWDVFDGAMEKAKLAEGKILDPEMTRSITKFEHWAHKVVAN